MKETFEYRKASAKWTGIKIGIEGDKIYWVNINGIMLDEWDPANNLDQVGIIINKLIKEHLDIKLQFEGDSGYWVAEICKILSDGHMEMYFSDDGKSIQGAFMNVFMEYIKYINENP